MKIRLALYMVVTLGAFAVGRYSVLQEPKVETKINKIENIKKNEYQTIHYVTVSVTKPDGLKTVTTTADVSTQDQTTSVESKQEQQKVSPAVRSKTNISIIGANDFKNTPALTYGLAVTHEVFGPLTVGVYALKSGVLGVSIGLNF